MGVSNERFGTPEPRQEGTPDPQVEAVRRASAGSGVGDMHGEKVTWRGHGWTVADVRNDGNHVHLTLTNPRPEPWSHRTTNDG